MQVVTATLPMKEHQGVDKNNKGWLKKARQNRELHVRRMLADKSRAMEGVLAKDPITIMAVRE